MLKFCALWRWRFFSLKQALRFLSALKHFGYWFAVLLIWELSIHFTAYTGLTRFLPGLLLTACFAAVLTLLLELPGWVGKICSWILPPAICLVYGVQLIYYEVFGGLLSLAFVSAGGDAVTTFYTVILGAIWRRLPQVLLLILPIVGYHLLVHFRLLSRTPFRWSRLLALVLAGALTCGAAVFSLPIYGDGPAQAAALFRNSAATVDQWAEYFGILTSELLDLGRQGKAGTVALEADPVLDADQIDYENWNLLEAMDFTAMNDRTDQEAIQTLNSYFASLPGTEKNEFTGKFAGYNLIVICAEAFSNYVIDPVMTPTLYKMSTEGIVFQNFYNSFPNLTTNGEYSLCMGLMPDLSRMSFAVSVENHLPYALGNICSANGMTALAYHNNVATFYNRINTHSNMGYDFRAVDHGLDMAAGSPSSDLEMMEKSMPDYLDSQPFHAYYMTYSGHSDYDFQKNEMSAKNRAMVAHKKVSQEVKAYIACQLELEAAMTYLLEQLEAAGIADKTLVVLTGDHLPYGLPEEAYEELAGEEAVQEPFWQYKNSFICWTGSMEEPVVVEDYCCTMDILPTVLNLMGLPYDSRLLTGRDVLADTTHMALLKDGSFLTEEVVYDASTGKAVWTGETDPQLLSDLQQYAANQFTVSAAILDTDYYAFAFEGLDLTPPREERETFASYADIEGTWYQEPVELLTTYGALSGGSTGAFNGSWTASRADFVAMLARSMGLVGSSGDTDFDDVSREDWYYEAMAAAVDEGLIPHSTSIRPTEAITVTEAAMILGRARTGDWFREILENAVKKQQEEGYEGARGTLSRGAAAYVVAMFLDPEKIPELTFKPVEEQPVQEPVWQPQWTPEPEPEEPEEPEEPWIPPADPLAPADPLMPEEPAEEWPPEDPMAGTQGSAG